MVGHAACAYFEVRGPIQLTFARSVDPIVASEHSITRMAVATEAEADDSEDEVVPTQKSAAVLGAPPGPAVVAATPADAVFQRAPAVAEPSQLALCSVGSDGCRNVARQPQRQVRSYRSSRTVFTAWRALMRLEASVYASSVITFFNFSVMSTW